MMRLDYAAIRRAVTMRQIFQLIHYEPCRIVGDQWRGPCPICRESSPATGLPFSANLRVNLFQCFRCHRAGNVLDLWMAITQLPIRPATLDLCARLQLRPATTERTQPKKRS